MKSKGKFLIRQNVIQQATDITNHALPYKMFLQEKIKPSILIIILVLEVVAAVLLGASIISLTNNSGTGIIAAIFVVSIGVCYATVSYKTAVASLTSSSELSKVSKNMAYIVVALDDQHKLIQSLAQEVKQLREELAAANTVKNTSVDAKEMSCDTVEQE